MGLGLGGNSAEWTGSAREAVGVGLDRAAGRQRVRVVVFSSFIFFSLLRLFSGFLVSFWFVVHVFWFNNDWCGLPASPRLRLFVPAAFDFQG